VSIKLTLVIRTKLAAAILGGGGVVRRKCSVSPVLPLWAGKAGFDVLHSKEMPYVTFLEDGLV